MDSFGKGRVGFDSNLPIEESNWSAEVAEVNGRTMFLEESKGMAREESLWSSTVSDLEIGELGDSSSIAVCLKRERVFGHHSFSSAMLEILDSKLYNTTARPVPF